MRTTKPVYPAIRQALHWTLAGLVMTQIVIMLLFRSMQSLDFGQIVLGLHLNVGLAILLVSAGHVAAALLLKAPPSPEGTPGWQKLAAHAVHILLVALVSAIATVGMLTAWARGTPVPVMFVLDINPPFEPNYETADTLLVVHGWLAWSLCGLIALHIGAVVFNAVARRVNVLKRMLPSQEMHVFRNRAPIGVQLFIAFAALVSVGVFVGLDALKHTKHMSEIAENTYDKTFLSLSHARSAQAHVKELIGLSVSGADPARAAELIDSAAGDLDQVVERAPAEAIKTSASGVLARLRGPDGAALAAVSVDELKAIDVALVDITLSLQGESFGARTAISKAGANAHDLILLAAVPTLTLACLAALAVWASVSGLVARLRQMTRAISDTDATAEITVIGKGEMAGLMRDVLACRESFVAQRAEVGRLSAEVERREEDVQRRLDHAIGSVVAAARAGDFSKRAPDSAELGRFRGTAQGLNAVCDVAERFLESVDKQATALAQGDLNYRMDQTFEGRFAKVAKNVSNATTAAVSRFAAEVAQREDEVQRRLDQAIGSVVVAARAGDFSQRAPEGEDMGQFLRITQSLNAVCAEAERFLDSVDLQATALANGDLTRQITQRFEGRFAKVADNVNKATRTLREAIAEANASSDVTHDRAQSILHNATDLARRGELQADSLAQTAAAMEEMTSSVASCADNSRTAATAARQAAARADASLSKVGEAVEAVDRIDKSSKQIAAVVGVIDEIAFQTRLLALNAAVEAARAGDAGRGFAVVAQEVRSLADGSARAAQDVRKLVDTSSTQVHLGVDLVRATGASFQEIVRQAREVAQRIDEISVAMDEQSRTVASLSKETATMDSITQQNSSAAAAMRRASNELAEEASRLAGLVSSFRTSTTQPRVQPAPPAARVARRA
jgi:methyl-accepting chemotaxis protein/cytochrome b561